MLQLIFEIDFCAFFFSGVENSVPEIRAAPALRWRSKSSVEIHFCALFFFGVENPVPETIAAPALCWCSKSSVEIHFYALFFFGVENPAAEIRAARQRVGWQHVEVSARRITLRQPGMALTCNGIAQGHAADVARAALRSHGVEHALINTGEYAALGHNERG